MTNTEWITYLWNDPFLKIKFHANLTQLELIKSDFTELDNGQLLSNTIPVALANAFISYLPYQEEILSRSSLRCADIFTSNFNKSSAGYFIDRYHTIYEFHGSCTYYLMVGRYHGKKLILIVPHLKLIIDLEGPEKNEQILLWHKEIADRLITKLHSLDVAKKKKISGEKIELAIGFIGNLGHFFWNEMSGLDYIVENYLDKIAKIYVPPNSFLDLLDLFPELSQIEIIKCSENHLFELSHATQLLPLRPVGYQINYNLRSRVYKFGIKNMDLNKLTRILTIADNYKILNLNVRAHNKIWLSQVEGFANIINAAQERYGDIFVVFDGTVDAMELCTKIQSMVSTSVHSELALSVPLAESFVWASVTKSYVSVVGSGLAINSWFNKTKGVAIANKAHLAQKKFWQAISPSVLMPYFINESEVSSDQDLYSNYDFDYSVILPQVLEYLGE